MHEAAETVGDEPVTGIPQPRISPGFLAAVPLFVAYEWGLATAGGTMGRNSSEMLLSSALRPFGEHEDPVRWGLLVLLALVAWLRARRLEIDLGRELLRTFLHGLLAALVLGPILIGLVSLFDVSPVAHDLAVGELPASPSLAQAARLFGAAIWEELAFRVVCYSLLYLFTVRVAAFFGLTVGAWHLLGDLVAILGSSALFAAFHLATFTRFLGLGGEPFEANVFLWRLLAGILLAGLFRWRGLGVVAWAHGLFNVALLLGADPGVFQAGG